MAFVKSVCQECQRDCGNTWDEALWRQGFVVCLFEFERQPQTASSRPGSCYGYYKANDSACNSCEMAKGCKKDSVYRQVSIHDEPVPTSCPHRLEHIMQTPQDASGSEVERCGSR